MTVESLIELLLAYRYWILFPIAVIEGPFLALLVGSLSALGYFDPFLAYLVLISGDFVPDTILYLTGRWGKRAALIEKYGHRMGITADRFAVIERLWREHPKKTMVMSKLALGLSGPFLVSAGLSGLSPRLYYSVAIPITLIQYAVSLFVGYHSTSALTFVSTRVGNIELFIGLAALFGILYYVGTSFMRRKVLEDIK
ncbi:MAG TPA: hypothetical protein VI483_01935 [Candidatus Paceibacterota bacterium]